MKRATLVLAALALLLGGVGQVKAGILPTHAAVEAQGDNGQIVISIGNGALDTGMISGPFGSSGSYMAQASTTPSPFSLLHAYASTTNAGIAGRAAWRDVAFVSNGNQPPALRFNFLVDGSLAATSPGTIVSNDAVVGLIATTGGTFSRSGDILLVSSDQLHTVVANAYVEQNPSLPFFASGWDSYTFDGSRFMGTLHIDTPYDPNLGGYGWTVELDAYTGSYRLGSATSDFGRTASLQSVTLPDGTPVTGVTFDSGLTFGPAIATPEPSTLTLLGMGAVCSLGYSWRRRRQSV